MIKYLYFDIECYKNYFLVCFKDHFTNEFITFELNDKVNEIPQLRKFLLSLTKRDYVIGFNIIHYDNILLNYILQNSRVTTLDLKIISDAIINDDYLKYRKYKRNTPWISVDLFLFWSKLIRLSRQISLKSLAVAINFPKIQELPYEPHALLTHPQQQEVKVYCYNDVNVVEELTKTLKNELHLRKEYGQRLNTTRLFREDDIKLGLAVIDTKFRERGLQPLNDIQPNLDLLEKKVHLSELILDRVQFKTPKFQAALDFYKKQFIIPKGAKLSYDFTFEDKTYVMGQGGLHSKERPEIFRSGEGYLLKEKDVVSYYPNLLIRNGWCPPQLPIDFIDIYEGIYNDRIKAKKSGDKLTNETNKLALNGVTGLLKSEYSPIFDPLVNLRITINGQLLLLMLIEMAALKGIQTFAANTDGVVFKIRPNQSDLLDEVCKEWEELHNLILEETHYKSFFKRDINNFLAETMDNKIKSKGIFEVDKPIIKSHDFLIISKALQEYFLKNVPIEETILKEEDIYMFCASFKVAKTYNVFHKDKIIQQLNRFYPSLKGHHLFKRRKVPRKDKEGNEVEINFEHLLVDSPVIIFNNYEKKNIKEYGVNYNYFLTQCRKIVVQLEHPTHQLKLEL